MHDETIQFIGDERVWARACVAERKMSARRASRAAYVVGMSVQGTQVDGRAGQQHRDQLQVIGVDKRRVQREIFWPLNCFVPVCAVGSDAPRAVVHRLACIGEDNAGAPAVRSSPMSTSDLGFVETVILGLLQEMVTA